MSDDKEPIPGPSRRPKRTKEDDTIRMRAELEKQKETLEELKELPQQIKQIFEMLSSPMTESVNEDVETAQANDANTEEDDPVAMLLEKSKGLNEDNHGGQDSLIEILNVSQPVIEFGPEINSDVAKSLSRLYEQQPSKIAKDAIRDKNKVPENCQAMGVPKINPEIWALLPSYTRQRDFSLQQLHQQLSAASVAVSKIIELAFSKTSGVPQMFREEMLRTSMDASSALASAADEINKRRKLETRPALNKDYAGICNTSLTKNGLLFGDNLSELLKTSRASSHMVKSVVRPNFREKRFQPYSRPSSTNSLNWKSPLPRARGSMTTSYGTRGSRWNPSRRGKQYYQPQPNK